MKSKFPGKEKYSPVKAKKTEWPKNNFRNSKQAKRREGLNLTYTVQYMYIYDQQKGFLNYY